jgi:hypothetical protein
MTNEKFEPIRIRIMKEAYDLADKGDTDGYNAIKVMCGDVQTLLQRKWVGLTEEEKHECYLKIDVWSRCVEAVEAKLKEKNGQ